MLTKKQKDLLLLIKSHLDKSGIPPSFDEMRNAVGLKSKSGIHMLINSLEERGFLKRIPYKARALEILKMPEELNSSNNSELPFYGRIAAGVPIEAISNPETLEVPSDMISPNKQYYVLEVSGDSMIDAGILSGDKVIIQNCDSANNGEIVVALVDENDVTLKFFHKEGNSIALKPANKNYETKVLSYDRIRIQGKLAGLLRKY